MNHLPLIIKREYLTKVRNKSFIIMTFVSPLIMIALIAVVAYLSQLNKDTERRISVLDETNAIGSVFENTDNTEYELLTSVDLETAKNRIDNDSNFGLLYIKKSPDSTKLVEDVQFFSDESPSISIISGLERKIEKRLSDLKLEQVGVDIAKIQAAKTNINIAQETFTGEKTSKLDNILKLAFGGAAGYLLFMFIIIYGNMIMRSVIEEKTSRIIEVIISSVKPIQLMMGKIIGTSLAGITQFAIWILLGGFAFFAISAIFGISMADINTPQQEMRQQAMQDPGVSNEVQLAINSFFNLPILNLIIAFLLFFIGGYLLYSSLYAAIGAAVDNETDTQQFRMPISRPLSLAGYVGVFTVIDDPHGTVSTVFSFIPLTSPVVMLMRIPFGLPIWQQLISFGIWKPYRLITIRIIRIRSQLFP